MKTTTTCLGFACGELQPCLSVATANWRVLFIDDGGNLGFAVAQSYGGISLLHFPLHSTLTYSYIITQNSFTLGTPISEMELHSKHRPITKTTSTTK